MNETILDIIVQNSPKAQTLTILRTPDHEYDILVNGMGLTAGPYSAIETIQFMMTLFREPPREKVIAQAFPTFGDLKNIWVEMVGPGLYDVVVGKILHIKRSITSEEVMRTLGHYLEKGGKSEPYIPPKYDENFWEIQRLLDLDDRGEDGHE